MDLQQVRNDFTLFLFILWDALGLPQPTKRQIEMGEKLATDSSKRFILQAFRGIGKSWITCAFVVWKLWNNPQLKFLIVSASKERADANSIFIKRIIDLLPFLHHLKPKDTQRNSVISFDVGPAKPDHSPSVKSVGITGQMTGSRADIIIADDVETPNNSMTQMMRDRLGELVKEFDAILKPLPTSQIIYLGTPQTEMTLYRELENRGYVTTIWPARFPKDEADLLSYGSRLFKTIVTELRETQCWWQATDPVRFDEDDLNEREISYGRAGFALQFQLNPSLSDESRYPLKLRDLIVAPIDRDTAALSYQWMPNEQNQIKHLPVIGLKGDTYHRYHSVVQATNPYLQRVMIIDPSGRGKDETAYSILYTLNGYIYVMAVGGMRGGYEDTTLEKLARLARTWKVQTVIYESNFGDGMFGKVFQPVLLKFTQCAMEEYRSKGQKEVRIAETLEPVMSAHRLVVREEAVQDDYNTARNSDGVQDQRYSCFYQLTRLTKERNALAHDDRLDALAIGVDWLKKTMELDSKKGQEQIEVEWIIQQLDKEMSPTSHSMTVNGMEVSWESDSNGWGSWLH